jgi:hypothetical protein
MTCSENRVRQDAVRRTFLASPPPPGIAVLFVEGGGAAIRHAGDTLVLPIPDNYETLPWKTRAFFRWAVANTECRHILKCDDDSYLHLDVASQLELDGVDYAGRLTAPVPGIVETWHFGKCHDKSREVPFTGPFPSSFAEGFGYFVSRAAASIVSEARDEDVQLHILEDVFVGWCLERAGSAIVGRDLSPRVCARRCAGDARPNAYVRHPLDPAAMLEAHKRFGRMTR